MNSWAVRFCTRVRKKTLVTLVKIAMIRGSESSNKVEGLRSAFNRAVDVGRIDSLLLIANFVRDFLCIHPFNDENGRMPRILTTLLLYRAGRAIFYVREV